MSDTFDLGGGGGTNFSWGPVGTQPGGYVQGIVLDMKEVQKTEYVESGVGKPEFWDNGDPKMQYRVSLQTELRDDQTDDGQRDVYLDGRRRPNDNGTKSKLCAVLDAVREATGTTQLQRGGKLTLQWTSGMGFAGDPRGFAAWYEAPAMELGAPGATPPGVQPAAAAPPASAQPAAAAPVAAPPAAPVQQPPAAPPTQTAPVAPPAAAPAPAAPAAQNGPTPEAIAALKAANVDPATVYPGWVDPTTQGQVQPVG